MDYSVKIKSKNYISHLNQEYEQRFIDNLNAPLQKYKFLDIIGDNTNIHLFRIINLEDIKTFCDLIYDIYITFKFLNIKEFGMTSYEYIIKIIQDFKNNENAKTYINQLSHYYI